jgi:very-short-patch-repair endonuclease
MLKFPKPTKKPKKPWKPITRSPIKKCKGSFKASDNGKRTRRRTDADVMAWALQKQAEKLRDLSPPQMAVGAILREFGIRFEFEKIWPNGDNPCFSDLYLPDHRLTIEVDGDFHKDQRRADTGKAMYIARQFGVGTMRFWNKDCLNGKAKTRLIEALGLTDTTTDGTLPTHSTEAGCSSRN